MKNKRRAQILLAFYFQQVYEAAGLTWNDENDAEIEEIIQIIMGDD